LLIVCLLKGVPAKTTQVVTVSGVLKREEMELVLNPHDVKVLEAAYYVKRTMGGKIVGISMGPEPKIAPIMNDLYQPVEESRFVPHVSYEGLDERIILSDRKMAGADTWATSYTLACGIKRYLENHHRAVDMLLESVKTKPAQEAYADAEKLYSENMLPNYIFSKLPTLRNSLMARYLAGEVGKEEVVSELERHKQALNKFIILAGMKTSDGETGNTGPQTAEALSQMLGRLVPSIAFVKDFEISPETGHVIAVRKVGGVIQKLRTTLPCLLTIEAHYEPRVPSASYQKTVRANRYAGKMKKTLVWDAEYIGADPQKIGFAGSPTIVGPGYEIGKPPTQKFVGETLVFKKDFEKFEWNGKSYGPFKRGDNVNNLPEELVKKLKEEQAVGVFTLEDLFEEVLGGLKVVARAV